MANAKKRRARKWASRKARTAVDRAERVKPSPLAEAKKQPWTLQSLLRLGSDGGGIEPEQFEAALLIVEAFRAITRGLGFRPLDLSVIRHGFAELSPREVWLSMIYLAWGHEVIRRLYLRPHVVVEWIEDERHIDNGGLPILVRSLDLWDTIMGDFRRETLDKSTAAA
jgi:hypothetical protein